MKLICVDLEWPLPDLPAPDIGEQWVLVRLHGRPMGVLQRTHGPGLAAPQVARLVARELVGPIARHLAEDGLGSGSTQTVMSRMRAACPQRRGDSRLNVTVAVCTRGRARQLLACLDALTAIEYPTGQLELMVVDNAPEDEATANVVARYGSIRYVCEPRPGLDWARNRAVLEARGDIVAFTDDDVSVDPGWVRAIAAAFESEPAAACVTGLVMPDEVDTPAQILFERYGGFGRGFERRVFQVDTAGGQLTAPEYGGAGRFGTGANMAFRRDALARIGPFDPALDIGTPSGGGGDLEMFFRVLKSGAALVYEPAALVRHRHRRNYAELKTQLTNNGIGLYAYLSRSARAWPDERLAIARLGAWWLWWWSLRRLARSFVAPRAFPRDLIVAELAGSLAGVNRYRAARAHAAEIASRFPSSTGARA